MSNKREYNRLSQRESQREDYLLPSDEHLQQVQSRDIEQAEDNDSSEETENTVFRKEQDGSYSSFCKTCRRLVRCPDCGQKNGKKNVQWKLFTSSDEEETEDEESEEDRPGKKRKQTTRRKRYENDSEDEDEEDESESSDGDSSDDNVKPSRSCKRRRKCSVETEEESEDESD